MIEKVNDFPLEKLYFLESKQFLDKTDRVFLKSNDRFKLNSYCLGISKQKYNNDNLLYLFNGLRGYYEARTKYLKKPSLMQIKPPLSKKVYNNEFVMKKYRFSNLLIYSLNDFNRPTITLLSDVAGNLYYDFPYRLIEYLNKRRHLVVLKNNYNFWKKTHSTDLRHVLFNFKKLRKSRKKLGFFKTKILSNFILGYTDNLINIYFQFEDNSMLNFKKLTKLLLQNKKQAKPKLYIERKKKGKKNNFVVFKKKKLRRFFRKKFKLKFNLNKFNKAPLFLKRYLVTAKKFNLKKSVLKRNVFFKLKNRKLAIRKKIFLKIKLSRLVLKKSRFRLFFFKELKIRYRRYFLTRNKNNNFYFRRYNKRSSSYLRIRQNRIKLNILRRKLKKIKRKNRYSFFFKKKKKMKIIRGSLKKLYFSFHKANNKFSKKVSEFKKIVKRKANISNKIYIN